MDEMKVINVQQTRVIHNYKNTKDNLAKLLKPTGHVMHHQFNTLRTGSFELFKRPFPEFFLTILTL